MGARYLILAKPCVMLMSCVGWLLPLWSVKVHVCEKEQ